VRAGTPTRSASEGFLILRGWLRRRQRTTLPSDSSTTLNKGKSLARQSARGIGSLPASVDIVLKMPAFRPMTRTIATGARKPLPTQPSSEWIRQLDGDTLRM
jgi:hypothetical protein